MNCKRTHTAGELSARNIEETIALSGWVHRRRDHGGLIFIDLRDRFGITQVVFHPEIDPAMHEAASHLRSEWVIHVEGKVVLRAEGMANPKLKTGEIEIEASSLTVLSKAKTPPFSLCDEQIEISEELRLKYRYLDMRRGPLAHRLAVRHKMALACRNYLDRHGFRDHYAGACEVNARGCTRLPCSIKDLPGNLFCPSPVTTAL